MDIPESNRTNLSETTAYVGVPSHSATIHRPFYVCKGCAGLINIIHSDILCDHVPDFNIDGFNVFSLAFWKATSKTFRALNSLHFSFALSRKYKSSIDCHNYFMSEYQRRFLSQQSFTSYRAAFTLSCQMGQEPKPPRTFEVPLITALRRRWWRLSYGNRKPEADRRI